MKIRNFKYISGMSIATFVFALTLGIRLPIITRYTELFISDPALIGLFFSLPVIISMLIEIPVGELIERANRKLLNSIAIALHAIAFYMMYTTTNIIVMALACAILGLGIGLFWPTAETIMMDLSTKRQRGLIFGIFNISYNTSWAIGPVIGGVVALYYGVREPIVLALCLAVVSMLMFWKAVPKSEETGEKLTKAVRDVIVKDGIVKKGLAVFKKLGFDLKWTILMDMLQLSAFSLCVMLVPLLFANLNELQIGWVVFAFSAAFMGMPIVTGRLADSIGKGTMITLGMLLLAASLHFLIYSASFEMLMFWGFMTGVAATMIEPIVHARLADGVPARYRGELASFDMLSSDIAMSVAPVVGGVLAKFYGAAAPLQLMVALSATAGLISIMVYKQNPTK